MTRYKLNPDQLRSPRGGHHFKEGDRTITGKTFEEVVRNLRDYRVNNHSPEGDPEQDVLAYYALTSPWMVQPDRSEQEAKNVGAFPMYRVWLDGMWKKPPTEFTSLKDARERLSVCEGCPFFGTKDWPETKETEEVGRRSLLLRKGMEPTRKICFCRLHSFADLLVLSALEHPSDYASQKEGVEKPNGCWV